MGFLAREDYHMVSASSLTILGRTNWRDRRRPFGITEHARRHHVYVIGQTGTGKSTLLEHLMLQDATAGRGFAFLDPHGDTVDRIAARLSAAQRSNFLYLDAADPACPLGFNPLRPVRSDLRSLVASGLLEAFKKIWDTTWGPRLEHIFRNVLLTLLDQPTATLADIPRLFNDKAYLKEAVRHVTHEAVREFWEKEFARYPLRYRAEALAPLQNKLGAFLSNPHLSRILTNAPDTVHARSIMDTGKVLLVNLAKGSIGADACSLLGALLVSWMGFADNAEFGIIDIRPQQRCCAGGGLSL